MEYVSQFIDAFVELSHAMSFYMIFGLVFAGILHEIIPDSIVTKHLGQEKISSVVKATIFGIPLPVCSCGVIPLATGIKKSGASRGATLSFLISTPITGIDSMMATYGIFGWLFMLYRVVSSIVIAILAGILVNIFDKETLLPSSFTTRTCCASTSCCGSKKVVSEPRRFSFIRAMHYAFVTLFGDIAFPLFWGLAVGALITVAIPENLSVLLTEYAWLSYLIVIAIAVPMYVCATASLPIAAGLMLSGVSAGAAFIFLSAGPATNTVTMGVVKKMLGNRSLVIYLSSIVLGSIVFGLGLDYLFGMVHFDPKSLVHLHEETGLISLLSSVVLWSLLLWFIIIRSQLKKFKKIL